MTVSEEDIYVLLAELRHQAYELETGVAERKVWTNKSAYEMGQAKAYKEVAGRIESMRKEP